MLVNISSLVSYTNAQLWNNKENQSKMRGMYFRMKNQWTEEELVENFILLPAERQLINNKRNTTQLGFAVLFKYFQQEACFPTDSSMIPLPVTEFIAKQLEISTDQFKHYDWRGRTLERHRAEIRQYFGFREHSHHDAKDISQWLIETVLDHTQDAESLKEKALAQFRQRKIEPPSDNALDALIKSAIHQHEEKFYEQTLQRLSEVSKKRMDASMEAWAKMDDVFIEDTQTEDMGRMTFSQINMGPGRASKKTLEWEIKKLKDLKMLELPHDLFSHIPSKMLKRYRLRAISEKASERRRHPPEARYTLLSAFFWSRCREITDSLIELLMTITHNINGHAEKKVDRELLKEIKHVRGKNNIIATLLEDMLDKQEHVVKDVLFAVMDEETAKDLLKELKYNTNVYREKVYYKMRSSYSHSYRTAISELLHMLDFRSNNPKHQPVIQALDIVRKYIGTKQKYFPIDDNIPVKEVIPSKFMKVVLEKDTKGNPRVNRINYEIAVLQSLRDQLRCKEIWVVGADRYRNPDEDLPLNFEEKREEYYDALGLSMDVEPIISKLQDELHNKLEKLNQTMPKNPKVSITNHRNGWISLSPLDPQQEPERLRQFKQVVAKRWWLMELINMFKETDLRTDFTRVFQSLAKYERLDRENVQKRLLLCLYGLGTNMGLKRMAAGNPDITYDNLLYVKRKYIHPENLKAANVQVVNAILKERLEDVWGQATTSCASDSKKMGAWDQNLMSQWHPRYRGTGVMIYWHVEKQSVCFHSQLKTCLSSEVASMIQGLLHHATEKDVDRNYVDTHGQSEVGFAFCHLLGFKLMPRFKNIGRQKLYKPHHRMTDAYPNLQPVLAQKPIDWDLIRQQYDQMVKYATALKFNTADTEAILKRFSKNKSHPVYKALSELGKVIKTIFLCDYLMHEEMRQEIQEGLNVVENWNSAIEFIFFGNNGEIQKNQVEDQEIAVRSLQLLQNCLVYINTLKIQKAMKEHGWLGKMKQEDLRALSPLIYNHITPYGRFEMDLDKRLVL